jgi:Ca-activated chloride channel family protein
MSFAAPWFLTAVALVPLTALLHVAARRRRRRFALRHPGAALAAGVAAVVPAWRRRLPAVLLGAAAVALAVSLARPQATVAVPIERASVMLVTDESGSMLAADVEPSRLEAAQDAARSFLDEVPDELLVGLIGYSATVQGQLEPTTDHQQVRAAVDALRADGGTATGDALTAALERLEARRDSDGKTAPAAIVLLSDGKTTEGSDPLVAADRAAELKIPIFTVALGTDEGFVLGPQGEPLPVPPDPATLQAVAERSGGRAFAVEDADALSEVYEDLGSRIGTREEEREVSAAFAGVGLLLLAGGLGSGLRLRGARLA